MGRSCVWWLAVLVCCAAILPTKPSLALSTLPTSNGDPLKFVVLGGTGKIGTAVAAHLSHRLFKSPQPCEILLVGRRPSSDREYFQKALQEIEDLLVLSSNDNNDDGSLEQRPKISYECVPDIWKAGALDEILLSPVSCVIHTAGPYANQSPSILDACIDFKVPAYIDISDPIDFLESSLERFDLAVASGTTAVLAAGAFPGLSNLLAMEAAEVASKASPSPVTVRDVRFNYFTKGLGGSGTINLYITNLGFGDPMVMHDKGKRTRFEELSGRLLGKVDFFINDENYNTEKSDNDSSWKQENAKAKARVGSQKVFAWPFPEAATVASELSITGSSSSAMGTAPDIWNDMLGLLVDLIPRSWWKSPRFCKFLADFSEPLVLATDVAMRKLSSSEYSGDCGETHAMRVDVVTNNAANDEPRMTSIVQCHDSFRRCVGQSCAEFALDALCLDDTNRQSKTGVYLPEQRYKDASDRTRILQNLVSTPGTFCYTGPVDIRGTIRTKEDDDDGDEGNVRILLKSTPTPGLICNGAPIEVRLETSLDNDDGVQPKNTRKSPSNQLPVYPTGVREIVETIRNGSR